MKKILCLILTVVICTMLFAACSPQPLSCEFTVSQVDNTQNLSVSWTGEDISKMEITVTHGDMTVSSTVLDKAALGNGSAQVEAFYGKHSVTVKATNSKGQTCEKTLEATLSNSEYIIAPISGSMPQLYFTLNMKQITNDGAIPAFVWLARPDSWNWDNLPENVYPMPNVDISQVLTHNNYDKMVETTNAYIQELFAVNKDAKFHLYINDFNSYLYLKLLTANGIPEENYYVTLLSDGGASYTAFNTAFDSTDPNFDADAKYDEMVENLTALYAEVKENGDYNWADTFTVDTATFRQYAYVAAREKDNVEWWILRPRAGVLRSPDEDFINRVLNDDKTEGIIEERNFAAPLKDMTDEEKTQLKALYNFNNEMFEAAEESGKKAMMILGSWATEENEPDFEAYVRFIKAFYGDEFVYYYKGHPNTPTRNYPKKQQQLESLGLIDVESSINAELILFFYPDIYMCGYNSSTFLSVQSPEMACAMFNMRKNDCTEEYKDLIGVYVSPLTGEDSLAPYLIPIVDLQEGSNYYFLLEYHNMGEDFAADIGLYNDLDGTITNYKLVDGIPEKIEN